MELWYARTHVGGGQVWAWIRTHTSYQSANILQYGTAPSPPPALVRKRTLDTIPDSDVSSAVASFPCRACVRVATALAVSSSSFAPASETYGRNFLSFVSPMRTPGDSQLESIAARHCSPPLHWPHALGPVVSQSINQLVARVGLQTVDRAAVHRLLGHVCCDRLRLVPRPTGPCLVLLLVQCGHDGPVRRRNPHRCEAVYALITKANVVLEVVAQAKAAAPLPRVQSSHNTATSSARRLHSIPMLRPTLDVNERSVRKRVRKANATGVQVQPLG